MLKNNIFTFSNKTLKQKRGTAIATKFTTLHSILYMANQEEEMIKEADYKLYLWRRYIDDIFFLWEHGEKKLKSFIDKFNKVHPNIKLIVEWSKPSINFLDVTVSPIEGLIETDLNVKPKDCQLVIMHLVNSFDKQCNDLEKFLLETGYSSKLRRKEILRASKIRRIYLLDKEKSQEKDSKLTFNVTCYSVLDI